MTEKVGLISEIENFLKKYKKQIIPYHRKELQEKKETNFDYHIYNECSLQHELGCYLREKGYEVFFEKNTKTFLDSSSAESIENKGVTDEQKKYEADLIIIKRIKEKITEKYAIELKFPIQGQYPEQMKKFLCDMHFMENLKRAWDKENKDRHIKKINTYCLTLVNDHLFYKKTKSDEEIYKIFRCKDVDENETGDITAEVPPPLLNKQIKWHFLKDCNNKKDQIRYYLINTGAGKSV